MRQITLLHRNNDHKKFKCNHDNINPFMHNVVKWPNILWPFFYIMREKVGVSDTHREKRQKQLNKRIC